MMTEEQAKQELFRIHLEYMNNPPQKRLELYEEYKRNRERVKSALARLKLEETEENRIKKL